MNSNDFVNWLQGYLEGCGEALSSEQMKALKAKVANVQKGAPALTPGIRGLGPKQPIQPATWQQPHVALLNQ